MRWRRQDNFHNGRSYDEEAPKGVVVSHARLTLAWLIETALGKFRKSRPPGAADVTGTAAETIVVRFGDHHGFTVLGSAIAHHAVHESAMTCPFPEEDEVLAQRRSRQRSAATRADRHAANDLCSSER